MRALPCCVATFHSTHDAIHAEGACIERGVPGRLIPLPVQINADCGLAWRMEPGARPDFERVMDEEGIEAGYVDLVL